MMLPSANRLPSQRLRPPPGDHRQSAAGARCVRFEPQFSHRRFATHDLHDAGSERRTKRVLEPPAILQSASRSSTLPPFGSSPSFFSAACEPVRLVFSETVAGPCCATSVGSRPAQGRFRATNLGEVNCGKSTCISGPSSRVSNEDIQCTEINTVHQKKKGRHESAPLR